MAVTFTSAAGSDGGVQSSYALAQDALLEGQLSDLRDNTISTQINETGAAIAYGNVVVYNSAGTVANSAKSVVSGGTVLGVNVLTYVDENTKDGDDRRAVADDQAMNVVNQGAVAVKVTGAVTPASPVRVIYADTAAGKVGQFAHAYTASKTLRLSNARFLTSTSGAGIAIVELNGPDLKLTADS